MAFQATRDQPKRGGMHWLDGIKLLAVSDYHRGGPALFKTHKIRPSQLILQTNRAVRGCFACAFSKPGKTMSFPASAPARPRKGRRSLGILQSAQGFPNFHNHAAQRYDALQS